MTELEACIALNMVPNLGPVRLRKLLEVFETPERVLLARGSQLKAVEGVGAEIANAITNWEQQIDLAGELRLIEEFGAHVITQTSPLYPRDLREIYNPPIVLYAWGEILEADQKAIGIVGSRKATHYGLECAKKLSYQLAYAGLTVISGLARGIDTAAHQGALAAQGRTIAVLGSGLLQLYPPDNQLLAEKISHAGAVVSEYPMNFPPNAQNFPYRNRIVAGWGSSLLVVEAGLKSGALITANQALEHGRLVYAVPGPIDRGTSAGTNRLIQQGAKLVGSAADVLEDLDSLFPQRPAPKVDPPAPRDLSPDETAILACLSSSESTLEQILTETGLSAHRVSSLLLGMEMKHLVKPIPGQRYVRLHSA